MRIVQISLAILDPGKGIPDLGMARPQGFDLRSVQHDPRFECFEDMIIASRFRVAHNIGHNQR
jgi:hypothetical protein